MRFNAVFLAAVAASLGHLQSPTGVIGLHMAPVHDNDEAVSANGSSKVPDAKADEERGFSSINLYEESEALARLIHLAETERLLPVRERDVRREDDLIQEPLFHQIGQPLQGHKVPDTDDVLADKIGEEMESKTAFIGEAANDMRLKIESWSANGRSPDEVLRSLELSTPIAKAFTKTDFLMMKELQLYIDYINARDQTHHSLIETLTKRYREANLAWMLMSSIREGVGAKPATKLLDEIMRGWMNRKLPVAELLHMLELHEANSAVFETDAFAIVERYMMLFMKKDMLEILAKLYKDEGKFALQAAKEIDQYKSKKAGAYLDALLWRWKDAGMTPDNLREEKFPLADENDSQLKFVQDRYRSVFAQAEDDRPQDLQPR